MRPIIVITLFICSLLGIWTACDKPEEKTCTDKFTDDRDGQEYCKVTIGTQTWMAENLRYNSDSSVQNPNNPSTINANYGNLYSYSQANKVCPNGWHLPTDQEWKTLEIALGMSTTAADGVNERGSNQGNQLKTIEGWQSSTDSSVAGTNSAGFNALPAGDYNPSFGPYFNLGSEATFWTASVYDTNGGAWNRSLRHDLAKINRTYISQQMGFACRCVLD